MKPAIGTAATPWLGKWVTAEFAKGLMSGVVTSLTRKTASR